MKIPGIPTLTLEPSWNSAVGGEFKKPYMLELESFIASELAGGKTVRPDPVNFFAALNRTPLERVRAVIIGQDPYFNPGEAHGLSFSVPRGMKVPSSLRNIYKELLSDIGMAKPDHGCLESWADQGVLLLNSILSVEQGHRASHAKRGWERFTDCVVNAVNERPGRVVFLLWGAPAQEKAAFVDQTRHLIVASSHPSGLSAYRGFWGSRSFSRTNSFLLQTGQKEIDWNLL